MNSLLSGGQVSEPRQLAGVVQLLSGSLAHWRLDTGCQGLSPGAAAEPGTGGRHSPGAEPCGACGQGQARCRHLWAAQARYAPAGLTLWRGRE